MTTENNQDDTASGAGLTTGACESELGSTPSSHTAVSVQPQPTAFPATAPTLTLRLLMMQKVQHRSSAWLLRCGVVSA